MSSIFKLNLKDLFKGLVVALFVAVLTALSVIIKNHGIFHMTIQDLESMLNSGSLAMIAYLLKNFLTDSDDKFVGKI